MIVIPNRFTGILDEWMRLRELSPPPKSITDKLSKPTITVKEWVRAIRAVASPVSGTALGLEIGQCIQLHHAGPLGYLVVNNHTFGEFLETYMHFEKWFYGENWVTCEITDIELKLQWDDRGIIPDRLFEQVNSMALVTAIRKLFPTVGYPVKVEIMNDDKGESKVYKEAFNCPVQFSSKAVCISYPISTLKEPIDTTETSLFTAWKTRERTLDESHEYAVEFVRSVQACIFDNLITGAPSKRVAANLNLSLRTMQRRLHEVGCNYQQLLDGIREGYSRNLLRDGSLNLKEIAFLLGYADQSAFNHAYHRWTGHTPLQTAKHAINLTSKE